MIIAVYFEYCREGRPDVHRMLSLRDSASSASVNSEKGIMYYYRMNGYGFYADMGKVCDETDERTDSAFQTT